MDALRSHKALAQRKKDLYICVIIPKARPSPLQESTWHLTGRHCNNCLYNCLPGWLSDKESACNVGSISGSGRFPELGNGHPLQYSSWRIPWTEEPDGLQSIGHKESDTTE